jgi:transcriptional regulator with XRE-family HTH domain
MSFRGDRLRALRKKLGLSQDDLAAKVGLSQKAISDLERGQSMKTDKLYELAKACGVSPEWLLGAEDDSSAGRGVLLFDDNLEHVGSAFDHGDKVTVSYHTAGTGKTRFLADWLQRLRAIRELDVRGGASIAGIINDEAFQDGGNQSDAVLTRWGLPADFLEGELGLNVDHTDIIRVRGDSMDDGSAKGLSSGDRVIVDKGDVDVRQGGIFAVFDGDGVIIKQVELLRGYEPPQIVCKSLNTRYDPIPLTLESPVRVIGRIAGRISRM